MDALRHWHGTLEKDDSTPVEVNGQTFCESHIIRGVDTLKEDLEAFLSRIPKDKLSGGLYQLKSVSLLTKSTMTLNIVFAPKLPSEKSADATTFPCLRSTSNAENFLIE